MIKSIITSDTRIKLLMKFFINPHTQSYLRQLASEFGESTNGIRLELNKLAEAKILNYSMDGRNKIFQANTDHPLFKDIQNIILKSIGIDKVITDIINKIGELEIALIRGDYAKGIDSGLIELVIVGSQINFNEIERVRKKTEKLISRKISIIILKKEEYTKLKSNFIKHPYIILVGKDTR